MSPLDQLDRVRAEERAARPDACWLDVDLTDDALYRAGAPHDLYRTLRDQHPVWRHPTAVTRRSPEGIGFWAVLGHPEAQAVSRDWRTYSSVQGLALTPTALEHQGHTILTTDPPAHTHIRKLISAGFTPRTIARLDELVVHRTTQVLEAAAEKNDVNFVRDVAYPLPMHMIGDIMGIPEQDRADVFHWTDVIMRAADQRQGIAVGELETAHRALFAYAADLGESKRRKPGDDVWSILSTVTLDNDAGRPTSLTPLELDQFFLILSIAGSETTRNVISTGLVALLEHPDQLDRLRRDTTLLPSATEELLRWATPVTCHLRTATRDHELGGQHIERGDRVAMFFPAANRDPRSFDEPDRFDLRRDPNPHVAFGGGGAHYCLGAALARREISVMFRELLARFPHIEPAGPISYVVTGIEQTVAVSLDEVPVRLYPC
jgi:cytochrome P450